MKPNRSFAAIAVAVLAAALLLCPTAAHGQTRAAEADRALARDVFREIIGIDTSAPDGDPGRANRAMAARLIQAGFPDEDVEVVGTEPRLGNLVARLRGSNPELAPLLLMAHMDVVPAHRDDWSSDPFTLTERDGYFIGRGAIDNKAGAAILVTNFLRYRRDGYRPERDVIVVLTADEETTMESIRWLLEHHPDVRRAGVALNTDAGGGELRGEEYAIMSVQASEKVYQSYRLEVRNPGGHSSVPRDDNAIYTLAAGLMRLAAHRFPVQLNEVSRAYFRRSAELGGEYADAMRRAAEPTPDPAAVEQLSGNVVYDAIMRTTCVATMLEAGHAENALPQTARAIVNCRVLPSEDVDEVDRTLERVLADDAITVRRVEEPTLSPPSPLTPEVMGPVERLTAAHFPGAVVVPQMSTGATDGLHTRNAGIPTYGVSAIFGVPGESNAHGRDERIRVRSFEQALDFWYDLVRDVAGGGRVAGRG